MATARMPVTGSDGNGNGGRRSHATHFRPEFATASHRATLGMVKVVAAAMDVSPSRIYGINAGEAAGHAEKLYIKTSTLLDHGVPEVEATSEIRLLLNLLGYETPARRTVGKAELFRAVSSWVRESSDVTVSYTEMNRDQQATMNELISLREEILEAMTAGSNLLGIVNQRIEEANIRPIRTA